MAMVTFESLQSTQRNADIDMVEDMAKFPAANQICEPLRTGPLGHVKRPRRRLALIAIVVIGIALGVLTREDAIAVKNTVKPTSAPASPTLDLPEPISRITSAGEDRIAYRTVKDNRVGIVVADLATGRVLWQALEYLNRVSGVVMVSPAYVEATDSIVTVVPNTGASRNVYPVNIVSRDAKTGRIRWTIPSPLLSEFPLLCGSSVCIETVDSDQFTIVLIDPKTGKRTNHRKGYKRLVGGDDQGNLLTLEMTASTSAIASTTNWRGRVEWDRRIKDFFRDANVNPYFGYGGVRLDDGGWVLWLGSPWLPDQETRPIGYVAGIGPNGQAKWLGQWNPCFSIGGLTLKCDGRYTVKAGKGSRLVTRIEMIDLDSGRTRDSRVLNTPIDEFDHRGRLFRVGSSRVVISDPPTLIGIDVERRTFFTPEPNPVGWCQSSDSLVPLYYDASGQIEDSVMPRFSRPCRLGDTNLNLSEAKGLLQSKKLTSDQGIEAGRYVAWVADKKIVAVRIPT